MLIHTLHSGAGTGGVMLSAHTVSNTRISAICYAGIRFAASGDLYLNHPNGGWSRVSGEWFMQGTVADYYLHRTVVSGTLDTDGGTANQISAGTLDYQDTRATPGTDTSVVTFTISTSATPGTGDLVTKTITLAAEYDNES